MIVVATEDFELYHDLVNALDERQLEFTTVSAGEPIPATAQVVIIGEDDPRPDDTDATVLVGAASRAHQLVDEAVEALADPGGRTVIGVDPGDRPGVAVVRGNLVISAFQVPIAEAVDRIQSAVADDPTAVVRIGDGARLKGAKLINELEDSTIELVDETGTTPYVGAGARGAGDVLAAVNIATRPGEPVERRDIEPTPGELTRIKRASREHSPTNRELTSELARRVAVGELTLEQAMEHHRAE